MRVFFFFLAVSLIIVSQANWGMSQEVDVISRMHVAALKAEVRSGGILFVDSLCEDAFFEPLFGSELSAAELAVARSIQDAFYQELGTDAHADNGSLLAFIHYLEVLKDEGQPFPSYLRGGDLEERTILHNLAVPYTESVEQVQTVDVPVTETNEMTYSVAVPYTEMVEQSYIVGVQQEDGSVKNETRTRMVQVVKTRMEERKKMVPVTTKVKQSQTRSVDMTMYRREVRERTVLMAKSGDERILKAVDAERAKLCKVSFPSIPQGATVIYVRHPSTQVETLDMTTDGIAFLRKGDYQFFISKHPLKSLLHEATLSGREAVIEVAFENQSQDEANESPDPVD